MSPLLAQWAKKAGRAPEQLGEDRCSGGLGRAGRGFPHTGAAWPPDLRPGSQMCPAVNGNPSRLLLTGSELLLSPHGARAAFKPSATATVLEVPGGEDYGVWTETCCVSPAQCAVAQAGYFTHCGNSLVQLRTVTYKEEGRRCLECPRHHSGCIVHPHKAALSLSSSSSSGGSEAGAQTQEGQRRYVHTTAVRPSP